MDKAINLSRGHKSTERSDILDDGGDYLSYLKTNFARGIHGLSSNLRGNDHFIGLRHDFDDADINLIIGVDPATYGDLLRGRKEGRTSENKDLVALA